MRTVRYRPDAHRAACLALFDGHLGGAFRGEERPGYVDFLEALPGPYLVLVEGAGVVACGGWAREEAPGLASLCWTIVARARRGEGVGRRLVGAIMEDAAADPEVTAVRLETTPETEGFFRGMGFETTETDPDGYGPGLPRVEMRRRLQGRRPDPRRPDARRLDPRSI